MEPHEFPHAGREAGARTVALLERAVRGPLSSAWQRHRNKIDNRNADLTLWGTGRQAGPLPCSAWRVYVPGDIRAREGGPRCLSTSESTSTASVPRWR